jgi:acyl carrier protein
MLRLHNILIKVLEVEASEITDDMSPDTIESWDSFNGLMLVSELESVFGIKFTMQEIIDVTNVRDIKDALNRHGVELVL